MLATEKDNEPEYPPDSADARAWLGPGLLILTAVAGVLLLFRATFLGMWSTWWTSQTYSYGLIVVLVAIFLAWERRRVLAGITPRSDWRPMPLLLITGLVWLLAQLLMIVWLEQIAVIVLLILTVWALLGPAVTRALALPLGLLFLAVPPVPVHDAIVRPLMDFTGDIAVTLLGWSGIPFRRHGDLISLPSGNWSVEKVCSGARFFFSSAVLGILFASRAFRSWRRRLVFIAFALALPILANGVRVYITILIGHFEGVAEAIEVDHTVYGGLFGGLVLTIMFVVGAFWWETGQAQPPGGMANPTTEPAVGSKTTPGARMWLSLVACLSVAAVWPALAESFNAPSPHRMDLELQAPAGQDGWRPRRQRAWAWWPRVGRIDAEAYTFYQKRDQTVALYLGQSLGRQAGAELVDPNNVTIVREPFRWESGPRSRLHAVALGPRELRVTQSRTGTPVLPVGKWHDLVIWQWYRVGGRYTRNPYQARLMGLWSSLVEGRRDAALIVLATPYDQDPGQGDAVLGEFLESMLPEIEARLEDSRLSSSAR